MLFSHLFISVYKFYYSVCLLFCGVILVLMWNNKVCDSKFPLCLLFTVPLSASLRLTAWYSLLWITSRTLGFRVARSLKSSQQTGLSVWTADGAGQPATRRNFLCRQTQRLNPLLSASPVDYNEPSCALNHETTRTHRKTGIARCHCVEV